MRKTGVLGACLAAVLAAACQDRALTAPSAAGPARSAAGTAAVPSDASKRVDVSRVKLPPNTVSEFAHGSTSGDIDPGQYQCSDSSGFNDYINNSINAAIEQDASSFFTVYYGGASTITGWDALFYAADGRKAQTFGYTGAFTNALLRTERDVKRFWDIPSANIRLVGAHGQMLLDSARVERVHEVGFGDAPDWAGFYAHWMVTAMQSPAMKGGNVPFLTFNAFAAPAYQDANLNFSPAIMLGDGILEDYAAIGFADVAPQAIYAHEYGHQVQFANGYFGDPTFVQGQGGPESTRYTELMADAYSGYYLTHKRGAAFNRKRAEQFFQVFFQAGDCNFYFSGHHGTPNQRMKAARFGFAVADEAQKQGHILTSQQFHDRFVAYYPTIIAPDSTGTVAAQ